jgi:hypothetical protein
MGQFMAESSVLAGLVQLGVNGYPHLPFASAVSQGGKTRIRGRQDLEIHANSITDCRVLDRALQPTWFPLTLKRGEFNSVAIYGSVDGQFCHDWWKRVLFCVCSGELHKHGLL